MNGYKNQHLPEPFNLETIEKYGLNLGHQTGGSYFPHPIGAEIKKEEEGKYNIDSFEGYNVEVFDAAHFLKSVSETEQSLNLQLFK